MVDQQCSGSARHWGGVWRVVGSSEAFGPLLMWQLIAADEGSTVVFEDV